MVSLIHGCSDIVLLPEGVAYTYPENKFDHRFCSPHIEGVWMLHCSRYLCLNSPELFICFSNPNPNPNPDLTLTVTLTLISRKIIRVN